MHRNHSELWFWSFVNAGEEFPHFADLELPLLGQKNINRSRRLQPSCGLSYGMNPPAGLQCDNDEEADPD